MNTTVLENRIAELSHAMNVLAGFILKVQPFIEKQIAKEEARANDPERQAKERMWAARDMIFRKNDKFKVKTNIVLPNDSDTVDPEIREKQKVLEKGTTFTVDYVDCLKEHYDVFVTLSTDIGLVNLNASQLKNLASNDQIEKI